MEKELRCKICGGVILLSIIIAVNYPICKTCFKKLKEYPDIPIEQKQISMARQTFVVGINSTASTISLGIFNEDQWKGIL